MDCKHIVTTLPKTPRIKVQIPKICAMWVYFVQIPTVGTTGPGGIVDLEPDPVRVFIYTGNFTVKRPKVLADGEIDQIPLLLTANW